MILVIITWHGWTILGFISGVAIMVETSCFTIMLVRYWRFGILSSHLTVCTLLEENVWRIAAEVNGYVPSARYGFGSCCLGSNVFVFGGAPSSK